MSDDSRANRLRTRRRAAKERVQTVEPDEEGETDDAANQSEPAEPSKPDETAVPEQSSVKEEQVGTYMYLPESQKKELERVYTVAKAQYEYEFDADFEKNRHFFPLLIQYGIETLDGASAADIKALLEDL
ncbi:hypothetical protein ACFQH3_18450 [Haladaptatus sp. GCM10025707]|uniref:hypothetical protein n=1 Tax=unclassified Haladaptatus TaxID=2622732 RepID=UPI0023E7FF44|nr:MULTISPECIES: hypothetical protein [unclassified Haladaptatus]